MGEILDKNSAFRMDERTGPEAVALLGNEEQPWAGATDATSFPRLVLENVRAILGASLRGAPVKSVWGRALEYHLLGPGRVDISSWRVMKDPYCRYCTASSSTGKASATRRLSRVLHENTKVHEHFGVGDAVDPSYSAGDVRLAVTAPYDEPDVVDLRQSLPDIRSMRTITIEEAILRRRSRREFGASELSLQDVSALLYFGGGVTKWAKTRDGSDIALRAAPSGGGLHPIDLFISARRVVGLSRGVYRYDPLRHALIPVSGPRDRADAPSSRPARGGLPIDRASVVFLLAATFERNQVKYLERGYRVVLLEAGHIAQNLHLVATARSLRSCCVTAFIDDKANELLGFAAGSGQSEVVYMVAVGR